MRPELIQEICLRAEAASDEGAIRITAEDICFTRHARTDVLALLDHIYSQYKEIHCLRENLRRMGQGPPDEADAIRDARLK